MVYKRASSAQKYARSSENYSANSDATLIRRVRMDLKGIGVDEGYRGEAGRWPIRKRKYERKRYSPAG